MITTKAQRLCNKYGCTPDEAEASIADEMDYWAGLQEQAEEEDWESDSEE